MVKDFSEEGHDPVDFLGSAKGQNGNHLISIYPKEVSSQHDPNVYVNYKFKGKVDQSDEMHSPIRQNQSVDRRILLV